MGHLIARKHEAIPNHQPSVKTLLCAPGILKA